MEAAAAVDGGTQDAREAAKDRLRAAIQRAARNTHATKTALAQHLAKEAAHLVPLLNGHFTPEEQTELVARFITAIPAGWVGSVLARGPTTGEQGPLRVLVASWLGNSNGNGAGAAVGNGMAPPSKRVKSSFTPTMSSPIDHIFQFHAALRRELRRLETDVLQLPPLEDVKKRSTELRDLEGRFMFFTGVYRAHSRSEDELVFPTLESKDELHNVSHSYTLDHEHESELFVEVVQCLSDLRRAAGFASGEKPYPGESDGDGGGEEGEEGEEGEGKGEDRCGSYSHTKVLEIERRLQAACTAVRVCLETHVAREEAELWPLFEKHFTASEQGRLVGLIIGRTGAEVLQSMLSWQRKALTEDEKVQMIRSMRDASRNTRFANWLETWWGEENGATADAVNGETNPKGGRGEDIAGAAVDGLGEVQAYLKKQQLQQRQREAREQQQQERRAAAAAASTSTSTGAAAVTTTDAAAKAQAQAMADAAAADKTGYTPQWDDMFRMNRQQLEEAARTLSRDDSVAPKRKAYLMQHLLAARWICSQQRKKQEALNEDSGDEHADAISTPLDVAAAAAAEAALDKEMGASPLSAPAPAQNTAMAALAAAGAKTLMAYRVPPDANLCQPINKPPVLGCKHYARKARLVAACCGAAHVCRFCHDEAEDHTIDRYATREMVCMACGSRQPSAKDCRDCGVTVARYFCSVCNFWEDSDDRDVYHCPFCNVCRRGKGLGKDFFHCMQCNSCVSLTMGPHNCTATADDKAGGRMESDCPVCKDFLFTSDTPVKCLPCGHFMHTACFEAYTKHYYTCPLCRKSLGDFTAYFRMLDAILAEENEANAETNANGRAQNKAKQRVLCNDCGEETLADFHFVYHACAACRSYNTIVQGVVPPSEVKAAEAEAE